MFISKKKVVHPSDIWGLPYSTFLSQDLKYSGLLESLPDRAIFCSLPIFWTKVQIFNCALHSRKFTRVWILLVASEHIQLLSTKEHHPSLKSHIPSTRSNISYLLLWETGRLCHSFSLRNSFQISLHSVYAFFPESRLALVTHVWLITCIRSDTACLLRPAEKSLQFHLVLSGYFFPHLATMPKKARAPYEAMCRCSSSQLRVNAAFQSLSPCAKRLSEETSDGSWPQPSRLLKTWVFPAETPEVVKQRQATF